MRGIAAKRHKAQMIIGLNSVNPTNICAFCAFLRLTTNGDAERADVAARVKSPQRDCVLARGEAAEVD